MTEQIEDQSQTVEAAVAEPDSLRAAYITALDNAHYTHPCPATGRPYWTGCVHYDKSGRMTGVGSCHSERRADAVLAVRDEEMEALRARVTELETERKRYVGVEPTIAEEMAYLSRCLDAVHEACDRAVRQATRWEHPLPIPEWVDTVRQAADGATEPLGTRPALPWAHVMDDHDLGMFLDDLVSAAMGRWQSDPEVPDRQVLAAVEKACADWRTPGQGLRGDEPGTGEGRG